MKKRNTKLQLRKNSIIELQEDQLSIVNGGSGIAGIDQNTNPCSGCVCDPVAQELIKQLQTATIQTIIN